MFVSEWLRRSSIDYDEGEVDHCNTCTRQRCKECDGTYLNRKIPSGFIPK